MRCKERLGGLLKYWEREAHELCGRLWLPTAIKRGLRYRSLLAVLPPATRQNRRSR